MHVTEDSRIGWVRRWPIKLSLICRSPVYSGLTLRNSFEISIFGILPEKLKNLRIIFFFLFVLVVC